MKLNSMGIWEGIYNEWGI